MATTATVTIKADAFGGTTTATGVATDGSPHTVRAQRR